MYISFYIPLSCVLKYGYFPFPPILFYSCLQSMQLLDRYRGRGRNTDTQSSYKWFRIQWQKTFPACVSSVGTYLLCVLCSFHTHHPLLCSTDFNPDIHVSCSLTLYTCILHLPYDAEGVFHFSLHFNNVSSSFTASADWWY